MLFIGKVKVIFNSSTCKVLQYHFSVSSITIGKFEENKEKSCGCKNDSQQRKQL